MANELNNLFTTDSNTTTTSTRALSGTAQLTATASDIANEIINQMNADVDSYRELIKASQHDHSAMDKLISVVYGLDDTDVSFIYELDDATVEGMLKSQQSKRSRCKSKAMTMDNYRSLMTAAIAENLIRIATGKSKGASGARRLAGSVEYTIEELEQLGADQEALRKEIRNVQSKKSIMKSKADFDESSERWQSLLRVEQQLKDMRVGTDVVKVDETKNALTDMLGDIDLEHLKAADSKELLARIAELVAKED